MQPPYPLFLSWADRLGESGGWRSLSQTERWRTPRTRPSVPCRPAWPCPPPSRTWTSRSPPPHSSSQADSRCHTDGWGRPWPVPASSPGRGTTCWLSWWSNCCLCSLSSQNYRASVSALTFIFPAQTERTGGLQGPREYPEFKGQINIKDIATTFSRTQHIEIFLLFWLKLSIYISKHLRLYSKTFIDSCFIYQGHYHKNSKKTSFKANMTVIHPCKFAKQ